MSTPTPTELPRGWTCAPIGDVGAVRLGRQRSPDRMSGRYTTKYLRAGNITSHGFDLSEVLEMDFTPSERTIFALRRDDVLVAEASGSVNQLGHAAIWREELPLCCFQNTVIRFRPHAALAEYALAVFRHYAASGVFAGIARGIGLQHLSRRRFIELQFPLPPLAEQERIVAALQAKLPELRDAEHALHSALARTHEQDAEILAAAVKGGLIREGRFNPPQKRVGDVGELTLGKSLGPKSRSGIHMRPYLRVANVLEDRIDLSDLKQMSFTDEELAKYTLRPGDVLLNDGQSPELVGRPAIYQGELPNLCFQNHLIRFRAGPDIDSGYALIVFRHYLHAGEFREIARGSTNIATLSRTRLGDMLIPVPPLDDQQRIVVEARRRLQTSAAQRETILTSLGHTHAMEVELLAAAASGSLTEQETGDEPAMDLLLRLGPPPREASLPREVKFSSTNGNDDHPIPKRRDLAASVAEAGHSLSLPELCRAVELNVDEIDAIETFYAEVRDALGHTITIDGNGESGRLDVITDAPR
jgi:type I restriction enzyme S subunit